MKAFVKLELEDAGVADSTIRRHGWMDPHAVSSLLCKESDLKHFSNHLDFIYLALLNPSKSKVPPKHVNISKRICLFMLITTEIHKRVSYYAWSSVDNKIVFYFMVVLSLAHNNKSVYRDGILPVRKNDQKKR